MGTRAQVLIKDTGIYLYQHYDGNELFDIVKRAIAKKMRWEDTEYLTRIIFSEMIKDNIAGETGYGIGNAQHGDIEFLVIVDTKKQTITEQDIYNETSKTISFANCN
jgi:hypothetical protein